MPEFRDPTYGIKTVTNLTVHADVLFVLATPVGVQDEGISPVHAKALLDQTPTDHGGLGGLADDDHTQYVKADGTRAFTGVVSGITPTLSTHLVTKGYVDSLSGTEVTLNAGVLSGATTSKFGINQTASQGYFKNAANNWERYEDAVIVRATGVSATDTAALVAAAAASSVVLIDDRDAPLTLAGGGQIALGDVMIDSRAGMARINLSNNTNILLGYEFNTAAHTSAPWTDCTVAADKCSITSATLTGVESGDVLCIVAEDVILGVNPHHYPSASASERPGEMVLVDRVHGTTIYLSTPLVDTYSVTPKVASFKINGGGGFPLAVRCGMRNIDFTGSNNIYVGGNTTGLNIRSALRPVVENVIVRNCGSIFFLATLGGQIRNVINSGQTYGLLDYFVAIAFSDDFRMVNCTSHRCRHVFTTSAQSASSLHRYGTIRRPLIHNCHAFGTGIDVADLDSTFTVNTGTSNLNLVLAANGFPLGGEVTLTADSGTLPAPLATGTDYYIAVSSGNTIQLTASVGGSPITLTTNGTGGPFHVVQTSNTNIAFDMHPEGYEALFSDCSVTITGPSSVSPSTGGSNIGFSNRARFTTYRNCTVYGINGMKHRGFYSQDALRPRYEYCNVLGGWCGIHTEGAASTTPGTQAVHVIGGYFTDLRCEAIILDGGNQHTIDGIKAEGVGSVSGGIFGAVRSIISFYDRRGIGSAYHTVRNCQLRKGSNLYSISIDLGNGRSLDSSTLAIEHNDTLGYDACEIGLDRTKFPYHSTVYTVNTGTSNQNLVCTTNSFTIGNDVTITNSGGAPPSPLVVGTTYYVVYSTGNDIRLSATFGGSAITLTTNGTGTNTVIRNMPSSRSLELRYGWKQRGRRAYTIIEQIAHGLTTASLFAPITDAHARYVDTNAGQNVVGLLVDVIDANHYCVMGLGTVVELPDSMVNVAYTIAGSGRNLYWDNSITKWIPTLPPAAHGDCRPMLYVDAYVLGTLYCRPGQVSEWAF
jgi:hypothetical protein